MFKTVRKGYDPAEVDQYISDLEKQLNEFKSKEEFINKAMVSAEMTASEIKNKAENESTTLLIRTKEEAAKIIENANKEAEKLMAKTENQIELIRHREASRLEDVKLFVNDRIEHLKRFGEDYSALAKKYFENPNNDEYNKILSNLGNINSLIDSFLAPKEDEADRKENL